MNRYALSAESRRWWWPSAISGLAASSAIAVITLVPASTYAVSSHPRNEAPSVSAPVAHDAPRVRYHLCFMGRPNWNRAVEGPQPRCAVRGSDAGHGSSS
jgi:hypothetical protein